MYETAIRMSITKENSHIAIGKLLGGQYGEMVFLPKRKKAHKDTDIVRSGTGEEYLAHLDQLIQEDEDTRA